MKKSIFWLGMLVIALASGMSACSGSSGDGGGQKLTGTIDGFKFSVINGGTAYRVDGDATTAGTVNIPTSYRPNADSDYLPVTELGIFAQNRNITKINIPSTITSIGWSAFWGCTNIKEITIPASVTSVGGNAFVDWTAAQTINIESKGDRSRWNVDPSWNGGEAQINYVK